MSYSLKNLCEKINFPEEVTNHILLADDLFSKEKTNSLIQELTSSENYQKATEQINPFIKKDNGFPVLKIMLNAALASYEIYSLCKIPEQIFIDTMSCFSRFVQEYKMSFGEYGFDRAFWVGRQLSLNIFRIGTLEYEKCTIDNRKAISIHIPSDADLSIPTVKKSFDNAYEFFFKYDPSYSNVSYYCTSWLMSPSLKNLLSPSSKIYNFQKLFTILSINEENEGYKQWVFGQSDILPNNFQEKTSLQRNIKQFVLNGGKIGEAFAILNIN